jgi:hypothetical protein
LRIQKEGLRTQKKMRFKMMSKKFADALLEEEANDDIMEKNKNHKNAMAAHRWWSI